MERASLALFFLFMPFCAALALIAIWSAPAGWPDWLFKLIPTTFILGLASFLTWFVFTVRRVAAR